MNRIASIDIFRAIAMLLMVFVDDLWTLHGVPHWLEHASYYEDSMGLSDIVFPAFLFIVGLSVPFAIKARINKGETKPVILIHIMKRALALIIMGLFFVNHEYYRADVTFSERNIRNIVMIVAFIMVWNNYEKNKKFTKIMAAILQVSGIFLLIALAVLYKGGTPQNPQWMHLHWWGILGVIGWAYMLGSLIYLMTGNRIWIIGGIVILLYALNAQEFRAFLIKPATIIPGLAWHPIKIHGLKFITGASSYALVMSGILATMVFIKSRDNGQKFLFPLLLLVLAAVALGFGFSTRPAWGISKIRGTPSWTAISAGISLMVFALIYTISDIYNYTRWAKWIMPAGRSTLTCYLLPILAYALFLPQLLHLPAEYTTGMAGILKSMVFALSIVFVAGGLEKLKISIKL